MLQALTDRCVWPFCCLPTQPPTVQTETVTYPPNVNSDTKSTSSIPLVKTQTRTVTYAAEDGSREEDLSGYLVSSQSHTSQSQTVETTTVSPCCYYYYYYYTTSAVHCLP